MNDKEIQERADAILQNAVNQLREIGAIGIAIGATFPSQECKLNEGEEKDFETGFATGMVHGWNNHVRTAITAAVKCAKDAQDRARKERDESDEPCDCPVCQARREFEQGVKMDITEILRRIFEQEKE
jgi:hypothetical protein